MLPRLGGITKGDFAFGALVMWSVLCLAGAAWIRLERPKAAVSAPQTTPLAPGVSSLVTSGGHGFGPASKSPSLVVFSDYQCPYCRKFALVIDSVRRLRPDIRIIERHYPVTSLHPTAFVAALAAECAAAGGQYDAIRETMFVHKGLVEDGEWGAVSRKAGIRDSAAFLECVQGRHYASVVESDIAAGKTIGVRATPSVVMNDTLFAGALSVAEVSRHLRPASRAP